jgi:hypothetical protein
MPWWVGLVALLVGVLIGAALTWVLTLGDWREWR